MFINETFLKSLTLKLLQIDPGIVSQFKVSQSFGRPGFVNKCNEFALDSLQ
jgi:hypothetical protein